MKQEEVDRKTFVATMQVSTKSTIVETQDATKKGRDPKGEYQFCWRTEELGSGIQTHPL